MNFSFSSLETIFRHLHSLLWGSFQTFLVLCYGVERLPACVSFQLFALIVGIGAEFAINSQWASLSCVGLPFGTHNQILNFL
jgi:hypothetical protein